MLRRSVVALVCLLVLTGCSNGHAPLVPSLLVPTTAQLGDTIRGSVSSYDKDNDSLYFLIDWGDGAEPEWVGPAPSATDYAVVHAYGDTGVFSVAARAKDATHETGWSDTSTIEVGEFGPFAPHPPAGPDTVSVGDTATYITAAGHPLQSEVSIQFGWGDTLGDWGEFIPADQLFYVQHAFTTAGTMLVRARARDTLDHVSDWSRPETVDVVLR